MALPWLDRRPCRWAAPVLPRQSPALQLEVRARSGHLHPGDRLECRQCHAEQRLRPRDGENPIEQAVYEQRRHRRHRQRQRPALTALKPHVTDDECRHRRDQSDRRHRAEKRYHPAEKGRAACELDAGRQMADVRCDVHVDFLIPIDVFRPPGASGPASSPAVSAGRPKTSLASDNMRNTMALLPTISGMILASILQSRLATSIMTMIPTSAAGSRFPR